MDMLVDEIKIGLAIFKKKTFPMKRKPHFKCSLLWSNLIFEQQFELKTDLIEDQLN